MPLTLSALIITYNHERYVADAIQGVLNQQTAFPIEVIICNDASTDNTHNIIENFSGKKYEGKLVRYFNHKENIGMIPNFVYALDQCKGKYVAICEGDDYWTDPYKLQKQVDFLESNPGYSICFHDILTVNGNNEVFDDNRLPLKNKRDFEKNELLLGDYLPTPTLLFRNFESADFNEIKSVFNGDTFLLAMFTQRGKAKYLPEVLPSYIRIHSGGIWSSKSQLVKWKHALNTYTTIFKSLNEELRNYVFNQYCKFYESAIYSAKELRNRRFLAYYYLNYMRFFIVAKKYSRLPGLAKKMYTAMRFLDKNVT